ncbi:MAG: 50S ribosomal protein L29 [bacterium]
MAKLATNELREKTLKELIQMRTKLKKELYELRIKNSLRGLKQTHLIKDTRRNIARINTALHYKLMEKNGDNMK